MDRVKDKVIVITGAASGLGLADSRVLAREGAQVVITDIDAESGQALAGEIGAHFITQDVSEEASWQHVMNEVESHFGRLDGLVNNAGIAPIANIEDTTTDVWRRDGYPSGCDLLGVSVGYRADEKKRRRLDRQYVLNGCLDRPQPLSRLLRCQRRYSSDDEINCHPLSLRGWASAATRFTRDQSARQWCTKR